jgi:phytoene dehydrogenase-like protein
MEIARAMNQKVVRPSQKSVIIIGGGLGGLSAAIRLAKQGFQVQIFERSDRVGGKCRVEVFNGYSFDTGPSLLTLPAVYRDLFLKTGAPLESEITLQPVDPAFDYYFANGKRLTLPNASRAGVLEAIRETFGDESAEQIALLQCGRFHGNLLSNRNYLVCCRFYVSESFSLISKQLHLSPRSAQWQSAISARQNFAL